MESSDQALFTRKASRLPNTSISRKRRHCSINFSLTKAALPIALGFLDLVVLALDCVQIYKRFFHSASKPVKPDHVGHNGVTVKCIDLA